MQHAVGAAVDRLVQKLLDAVAGHHDDLGVGLHLADFQEALDAVHARHHDVHEGEIEVVVAKDADRLLAVVGDRDVVAVNAKDVGQTFGDVLVVVDHEDVERTLFLKGLAHQAALSSSRFTGSQTSTEVPRPTVLEMSMPPWCCSMIWRTVGSPSPTPKLFVL